MNVRCRHLISRQQPRLRVRFYVVLVSEMLFLVMLGPACNGVFMATFVFAPILGHLTFFDNLILATGIPLDRHLHEGCINHLSCVHDDAVTAKLKVKQPKKLFNKARLGQPVTEKPYNLCVEHSVVGPKSELAHEAEAVQDRVLYVVVTDVVIALQDENLEHLKLIIYGSSILGNVRMGHGGDKPDLTELLEINLVGAFHQWIIFLREPHKSERRIEKSDRSRCIHYLY
jgi:hypothetical protein